MKLVACVAAVGEDGGYRGKAFQSVDDKARRAIAVLNVGAMDVRAQKGAWTCARRRLPCASTVI